MSKTFRFYAFVHVFFSSDMNAQSLINRNTINRKSNSIPFLVVNCNFLCCTGGEDFIVLCNKFDGGGVEGGWEL